MDTLLLLFGVWRRGGFGRVKVEEKKTGKSTQYHFLHEPRHLRSPHASVVDVEGEH